MRTLLDPHAGDEESHRIALPDSRTRAGLHTALTALAAKVPNSARRKEMLMDEDLTHSFIFSPPDHAPRCWRLTDPQDFTRRLVDAFPEAGVRPVKPWDKRASRWTLSFEAPLGEVWLEGLVTTPWPGAGSFSVDNATPGEAAVLLQWFREHFVPVAGAVVFTTGLGLENGVDTPLPMPAGGDVEAAARILGEHAEEIERSLGG